MQSPSIHWIRAFAIGLAAHALGLTAAAPASADCPYPSYVECLQAGETVEFCKTRVLNCDQDEGGGGDPDEGGSDADDCPYGNYVECLEAGWGVEFCKRHALQCNDYPGGGDGGAGESDPCDPLDDEVGIGCDGNPIWTNLSDPYDIVQSRATVCPYDSYLECLQAGETVEFCKRHVLNCQPGAPTQAQATVDFNARQCTTEPLCLCGQATGQITFYGVTVIEGDQICLEISSFDYDGPYASEVEPEIIAELDAIHWRICMPLECFE